jgi:hypothetical protein
MLQNARDSIQFTSYIKIKFNQEVSKLLELLILLE